jgi:hypothetical protein
MLRQACIPAPATIGTSAVVLRAATANMPKSRSVNAFIAYGSANSINQPPLHRYSRVKAQRSENCRTWLRIPMMPAGHSE